MIGGSVTNGVGGSASIANATLLNTSLSSNSIKAHFSSKLSGTIPAAIEELQLGTPFSLKPAASHSLLKTQASPNAQDAAGAAQQMESYFIYSMLKEMWATLPEDGFLDSGLATDIFQHMWLEKVADKLATTGPGIGLAQVFEQAITAKSAPLIAPKQPEVAPAILLVDNPAFKPIPLGIQRSIAIRPPLPNQERQLSSKPVPRPMAVETIFQSVVRPPEAVQNQPIGLYNTAAGPALSSAGGSGLYSSSAPLPGAPVVSKPTEPAPPLAVVKPKVQPKPPQPKPSSG